MADFKRVILLNSIKPSQFFLDPQEKELEIVFVKSDFEHLEEDVYSTKERILYYYNPLFLPDFKVKNIQVKMIESYKYDPYDIVYVLDGNELYKVYVF